MNRPKQILKLIAYGIVSMGTLTGVPLGVLFALWLVHRFEHGPKRETAYAVVLTAGSISVLGYLTRSMTG